MRFFNLRTHIDKMAEKPSPGTTAIQKRQSIAGGRDLVVLADGTGNSAAKSFKTNVWRLYQALDLTDGSQLAVFGDGVGTSSIKLMQYLGRALGLGVKRNVLNLYKFLCLNYNDGDRVWAFGFSRGAFTVRLLADLIHHEGLVSFLSEEELDHAAIAAYRAYRSRVFRTNIPWVWATRSVRDLLVRLRNCATSARQYSEIRADTYERRRHIIDIHFIGVWDTVAAYGLPVHELTLAFHNWVWPMLFDDRSLPPNVLTARQAISLDDERRTFFPIPWDEVEERRLRDQDAPSLDPDRLIQVWFAGTHANVGGGYPDDSLSYVPLCWMIGEAASKGLRFESATVTTYTAIASPTGRLYDSRTGFGTFYRYQPRDVQELMGPRIRALVHYEVITRMAKGNDGYAPISLPQDFDVLPPYGAPVAFDRVAEARLLSDPMISPEDSQDLPGRPLSYLRDEMKALISNFFILSQHARAQNRKALLELVKDSVWWRRLLYFVSLFFALLIVGLPLFYNVRFANEITAHIPIGGFVYWAVGLAQGFLPTVSAPWLTAFSENPALAIIIVAILFSSLWCSRFLQRRIRDRAREAWGVRAIVDGRRLKRLRLAEQRQAPLTAAMIFAAILAVALWQHSKWSSLVASGGALLSLFIFWAWRARRDPESNNAARRSFLLSVANTLRLNETAVRYYRHLGRTIVPFSFLLLCAVLFFSTFYRAALDIVSATGKLCQPITVSDDRQPRPVTVSRDEQPLEKIGVGADFSTSSMCHDTGLSLVEGRRYRITLKIKDDWFDKSLETDVGGFPSYLPLYFAVPLRRWIVSNWFEPVARVGALGDYEYPLDPQAPIPEVSFRKCQLGDGRGFWERLWDFPNPIKNEQKLKQLDCDKINGLQATRELISDIRPKTSGKLFIYVNDAVLLLPWLPRLRDFFYRNNSGSATVTVERIKADAIVGEQ